MQKVRMSFWLYLVGVAVLGLFLGRFEATARQAYGGLIVFLGVAIYLVALRLVGAFVERRSSRQ